MADIPVRDQWAEWIAVRRHGGDPEVHRQQLVLLAVVRDRILADAALQPGQTVLDVGCGDGLIGFAAVDAVGPSGTVIFSDISTDLLDVCRELADHGGLADACTNRQRSRRPWWSASSRHISSRSGA